MKLHVFKRMSLYLGILFMLISGVASADHVFDFMSPRTSDEYPPITSPNRYLINRMQCIGSYCDDIRVQNVRANRTYNHSRWSSYFSEEGVNYRTCSGSEFMTGVACKGGNCDDVSIQCTELLNTTRGSCEWSAAFSEEAGYSPTLLPGYYAAGLMCTGSRCDNLQIYSCRLN